MKNIGYGVKMKSHKILWVILIVCSIFLSVNIAGAGDFDWLENLSIQAQADPSGFKATLATRFKIGDTEINAVLSNVEDPADAYMVLRLGEMASKPTDYILKQYSAGRDKGWGVMARNLGIKPGSQEFKALKAGHDLNLSNANGNGGQSKNTGKNKNKGKKN